MAKSQFLYIEGKIFWCRAVIPEVWADERFWSVTVYPNAKGLAVVKSLLEPPSIMNKLKRDEDGDYIRFKRPCQRKFNGEIKAFTPPVVLDKEGQPLTTLVGNGSDGIVKLEVYQFNKPRYGRAARWESLRIDNLIPYESKRDQTEAEERQTRNFDQQPVMPSF